MKKAFTLAEVLITLVVIGIIAAITINIIFSNQDEAYRSGLKKSYSIMQQALKKAGINQITDVIFNSYMKVLKDCTRVSCNTSGKPIQIKNLTGTATYSNMESNTRYSCAVILQDGTYFRVPSISGDGSMTIITDVNGIHKGPNRLGKDAFVFKYDGPNDKLIPGGAEGSGWSTCNKSDTTIDNGAGCADILLRGGKVPR